MVRYTFHMQKEPINYKYLWGIFPYQDKYPCYHKLGRTQKEYREDNQDRIRYQQQDYRWAKMFGFGKDVKAYNAWWDAG